MRGCPTPSVISRRIAGSALLRVLKSGHIGAVRRLSGTVKTMMHKRNRRTPFLLCTGLVFLCTGNAFTPVTRLRRSRVARLRAVETDTETTVLDAVGDVGALATRCVVR